jgi:general secretion pathway protein D
MPVFVLGLIWMLSAAAPLAIAQSNNADPAALLSSGIGQYEQGQTTEARKTLERIDPAALNADQRVRLQDTLQAIERQEQLLGDPAAMLVQAEAAQKRGDATQAAALYEAVGKHVRATDQQKLRAATNLATLRRRQNPDLSRVRAMIDQASADLNAGRLAEAERKIREVRQSNVDLGWFDNNRLDRLSMVLAEQQAAAAPAATPSPSSDSSSASSSGSAAVSAPPAGPSSDLMAQIRSLALQERLASARAAEQNGNYAAAARFYEEALTIQSDDEQIKQSLEAARAKGQTQIAPQGAVQQLTTALQLHRQQVLAEYRQLMNTAADQYEARNYTSAREAVNQARVTLDQGQRALPAGEYKQMREEAVTLASNVDEAERQFQQANRELVADQQAMEVRKTREEAEEVTQREVQNLLRRAQELRREQKYDRSLELIDQALFLDPQNFAAQAMKEMIEDSKLYVDTRQIRRKFDYMAKQLSYQNDESVLPYTDLMNFPADWPQLTARRLAGLDDNAGESEVNRRIEMRLQEPVPVNFENNSLINVIDYLRNTTSLNFYVNWTALQNVGVEQDYPINLQLSNVPASQALALVLQEASAGNELDPIGYAIHQGIIKISTDRELKRTTVASRIYDIRDLLVRVPNFTNAPAFSLEDALGNSSSSGGSSGSSGGSGSSSSLFGSDDDDDDDDDDSGQDDDDSGGVLSREELIFQVLDLVRQIGRPEEWVAFGGDISSVTELNGNLIVRTTPNNQREVLGLLQSLRETRAMQINVEARFLLVDQNFLEEVGVDVDMRVADPGGNFGALTMTQDSFGVAARPNTGITGTFGQTLANAGANGLNNYVIGSGAGSGRSLDLGVSYLDDIEVALLVRASQNSRRAVTVTAPRLTFFNGQRAYITVARQVSFVSALEAVPDSNFFNPTLSVTQSGVVLDVEGTVSADRRFVTMTIRPALATIIDIRRVEFFAQTNNNNNNNNDNTNTLTQGFIEAPELELTELATTVSVPDKGTLLLGGQRLVGEVEIEAGVPVLSKMPFINRLFTNRSKTKDERTLLILIKPTIIIQSEEEELNFPGLQQNPTAYNVGRQF